MFHFFVLHPVNKGNLLTHTAMVLVFAVCRKARSLDADLHTISTSLKSVEISEQMVGTICVNCELSVTILLMQLYLGTQQICDWKCHFCPSKIMNFVENSNFCQILSSYWKVFNLQTDKYVLISKSVKRHAALLCITGDLYYWTVRVCLMSTLILYCGTSMFRDTWNIVSKMSFFVHPESLISSKKSSKLGIFLQIL